MRDLEIVEMEVIDVTTQSSKTVTVKLRYNKESKFRVRQDFYERLCSRYRLAGFDITNVAKLKEFLISDNYCEKLFGNNNLGIVVNVSKRLETFNLSLFDIDV